MIAPDTATADPPADHIETIDPQGEAVGTFVQMSAALNSASVEEVLTVIARRVRKLVGVARCSIYLRDGDAGLFRGRVTDGCGREMAPYVKRSLAGMPTDGMTCELLKTRRPVIIADAYNDPRMIRSNTRFWNIRSIMAVPMTCSNQVIGIIYLDNVDHPHSFTALDAERALTFAGLAASAVVGAQSRAELADKLEAAEARVRMLHRVSTFEERLSDLVLSGAELDDIVAAIAQMHGKPCAVYDAQLRRLAAASAADDELAVPTLLEAPQVHSPAVREALDNRPGARVFVVPPLPDAGVPRRHLVAPITIGGDAWGYLVLMEHRTRFSGTDMLMLRRASTQIAFHANCERRAIEADWNAGASLAAELLTAGSDPDMVAHRAARLGVRLDSRHVVVAVAGRDPRQTVDFRAVAAAFREIIPGLAVQAATLGQTVGALVEVPSGADAEEFLSVLKERISEVCGALGGELVAGVSSPRETPDRYPDGYAEARQIVECIHRFGTIDGQSVFTAPELGLGRVFLAHAEPTAVTSFAKSAFAELMRDESKRDLLATLNCFFENMASVRRCASELAVHENTIRYRLARVEELTGLAITHDPDAQLAARLSLLVLALSGTLDTHDLKERNQREAAAGLKVVGTVS